MDSKEKRESVNTGLHNFSQPSWIRPWIRGGTHRHSCTSFQNLTSGLLAPLLGGGRERHPLPFSPLAGMSGGQMWRVRDPQYFFSPNILVRRKKKREKNNLLQTIKQSKHSLCNIWQVFLACADLKIMVIRYCFCSSFFFPFASLTHVLHMHMHPLHRSSHIWKQKCVARRSVPVFLSHEGAHWVLLTCVGEALAAPVGPHRLSEHNHRRASEVAAGPMVRSLQSPARSSAAGGKKTKTPSEL